MERLKNKKSDKIVLGLPKGSLQKTTFRIFEKAGFNISVGERSYYPSINDPEIECVLLKPQEIGRYIEDGVLDVGITGLDWVKETNANVTEIEDLLFGKVRKNPVKWVLAVANESKIKKPEDLNGKIIATEMINTVKKYLKKKKIKAKIEFSWGATEVKARGLADAIVDVTETGSSLLAHNLRVIDTLQESSTRIFANKNAMKNKWKQKKIREIAMLIKGVIVAESKVEMLMNVPKKCLESVIKILPALNTPTISQLSEDGWYDVMTIVDKKIVKNLIPKLKDAGAEGIVEVPINRIID